jgi:hypothetical protein
VSKKIERLLARWEGAKRLSRSKAERIENKMMRSINPEVGRIKRGLCVGASERNGSILEQSSKYTPVFRARDLLNNISLFLLLIGC